MLVLTRREGEAIFIKLNGSDVVIEFLEIDKGKAKVGIDAPLGVRVLRDDAKDTSERRRT